MDNDPNPAGKSFGSDGNAAYTQLQAFLAQFDAGVEGRLPPERDLCQMLGVSRGALRKALAQAEAQGRIWRHVGKGTFFGPRSAAEETEQSGIALLASPIEVLRARLLLEPMLAREAALHASVADIQEMTTSLQNGQRADSWRQYETWDNRFHRAIANGTRNRVLLMMFDNLNNVRRTMAWARQRANPDGPPPDHHSFAEHARIVAAIGARNPAKSEKAMRDHLETVTRKLLHPETEM
ncbi:FadR/GntR family transcriptional regulator [Falsirhodobacter sp. alg1]|uniref:FadR/GntR family transcriptional regulator n=1 Tax=Falsirhodobacter sp. alg1 TaxID=1472418 RepID=UPI0005EE365A|nr:FCD domain-containing protein [Falsirhodobacter sp. alg1]